MSPDGVELSPLKSRELATQLRVALTDNCRIEMLIAFLIRGAQHYGVPPADITNGINQSPEMRRHCLPIGTPPEEGVRRTL